MNGTVEAISRVSRQCFVCIIPSLILDFATGKIRDFVPLTPTYIEAIKKRAFAFPRELLSEEFLVSCFDETVENARFCGAICLAVHQFVRGMSRAEAAHHAAQVTGADEEMVYQSLLVPSFEDCNI